MVARIWAAKLTAYDAASQTATIDDGTGPVAGVDVVGTFTPVVNAQVLVISDGSTVVVIGQFEPPSSGGGGGVTAHGALTGLANDDHPQYLTTAEGNAAYDVAGAASAAVAGHVGAADPHASYLRVAEVLAGGGITVVEAPAGTLTIGATGAAASGYGGSWWATVSQQLPADGSYRGIMYPSASPANNIDAVMNSASHSVAGLTLGPTCKAGRYWVSVSCGYAGNSAGNRALNLLRNGSGLTQVPLMRIPPAGGTVQSTAVTGGLVQLAPGDVLRVEALQTTGAVLDTAPNGVTWSMFYVGV